jgi:putative phosphoribosyl transferase
MEPEPLLQNRAAAGCLLAEPLNRYARCADAMVLGLPRGGIPVAYEVAIALGLELDAYLVRKLGLPQHPELAMGAIASSGLRYLNASVIEAYGVDAETLEWITQREWQELQRRNLCYRQGRPPPALEDRITIVVDDGMATGATMFAALDALKQHRPQKLIVAAPVVPVETYRLLQALVDETVCLRRPHPFHAVGEWYVDFSQTTDEEVCRLLSQAWGRD